MIDESLQELARESRRPSYARRESVKHLEKAVQDTIVWSLNMVSVSSPHCQTQTSVALPKSCVESGLFWLADLHLHPQNNSKFEIVALINHSSF